MECEIEATLIWKLLSWADLKLNQKPTLCNNSGFFLFLPNHRAHMHAHIHIQAYIVRALNAFKSFPQLTVLWTRFAMAFLLPPIFVFYHNLFELKAEITFAGS